MRMGKQFGSSSFQIPFWKYMIEVNRWYVNIFFIIFIIALRLQDKKVNYCIPNPYMELQKLQWITDDQQTEAVRVLSDLAYCLVAHVTFDSPDGNIRKQPVQNMLFRRMKMQNSNDLVSSCKWGGDVTTSLLLLLPTLTLFLLFILLW